MHMKLFYLTNIEKLLSRKNRNLYKSYKNNIIVYIIIKKIR